MTEQASPPANSFTESPSTSQAVRFLTDAFPAVISFVDTAHRYQFVNKAYEDYHGLSPTEIYGRHVRDVWGESGYEKLRPNLERAEAGEQFTLEQQLHDIHHLTTHVPHTGRMAMSMEFLILSQDMTELHSSRAALIQSEKMAAIGRLVAGILHEINTPLGVLRGNKKTPTPVSTISIISRPSPCDVRTVIVPLPFIAFAAFENRFRKTWFNSAGRHDIRGNIAADRIQHIFEPNFTRGASRIKAGLGLFVSRAIVWRDNGELRVTSVVGDGSCFTVVLPT